MNKRQEEDEPIIIDDSTPAGRLIAKKIKIVPFPDVNKCVHYAAYGDVEWALREIYENQPCGSLDVLNGMKSARGMIWNLKGGANRQIEFSVQNQGIAQGLAELRAMHLLARWTLRVTLQRGAASCDIYWCR